MNRSRFGCPGATRNNDATDYGAAPVGRKSRRYWQLSNLASIFVNRADLEWRQQTV